MNSRINFNSISPLHPRLVLGSLWFCLIRDYGHDSLLVIIQMRGPTITHTRALHITLLSCSPFLCWIVFDIPSNVEDTRAAIRCAATVPPSKPVFLAVLQHPSNRLSTTRQYGAELTRATPPPPQHAQYPVPRIFYPSCTLTLSDHPNGIASPSWSPLIAPGTGTPRHVQLR